MKQIRTTKERTKEKKDKTRSSVMKRSKLPNLFCDERTGIYYAIVKVASRRKSRSLGTKSYSEAATILPGVIESLRVAPATSGPGETLKDAINRLADQEDPTLAKSTFLYYGVCRRQFLQVCPPAILRKPLAQVTPADLRLWQVAAAKAYSPPSVNGTISLLNKLFERAIEENQITSNPVGKIKRLKIVISHKWLPTPEEFAELVAEIRANANWRYNHATADAVELLAYTGLRIGEARHLKWGAVSSTHLEVRNTEEFTTKNKTMRSIPINPALAGLLEKLRTTPGGKGPDDPVMLILRPTIGLRNACKRLGFPHLRNHDLRHLFATRCLEAGVDVPTVASWLGHRDGGALLSKVYSHVLQPHSAKQAEKVAF
jgi:integrase